MFPISDYLIKIEKKMKLTLVIIFAHVTMLFLLNLLGRGSIAVHSTQSNEARSNTVFEGLETGTPLTTKRTRNRLRKGMASNSRITIAIIDLLCPFVIISLIYVAFTYQSKRISIILPNSDLSNIFSRNGLDPTYDLFVFELMQMMFF